MTKLTVRLLAVAAIALTPTFALAQAAGGSAGGTGSSAGGAGAGATSGATTGGIGAGSSVGMPNLGSPSQNASPNTGSPTIAPGTTPISPGTTQLAPGTTGSTSGSSLGVTSDQAPGLQRGSSSGTAGTNTLPSAPNVANPPAQHPECASIADPLQHSRCLDQ